MNLLKSRIIRKKIMINKNRKRKSYKIKLMIVTKMMTMIILKIFNKVSKRTNSFLI